MAGKMLALAAAAALLAMTSGAVLPARQRAPWVGLFTALCAGAGGFAAAAVLAGGSTFTADFPHLFPLGGVRIDRKSTRLNSSHIQKSRMPSSA